MTICLLILYVLLALGTSGGITAEQPDSYVAAVLQHQHEGATGIDSPEEIINDNLAVYTTAAAQAFQQGADIIVFPEYGLFSSGFTSREEARPYLEDIPDPLQVQWNPCNEPNSKKPILTNLSCIARQNNLVVVANMGDVKPCSGDPQCPTDGAFQYNTNVVFDRNGTLLLRYYKIYPYFEIAYNFPKTKELGIFKTDFGTFGTMTCFDILFSEAIELVQERGVKNVAFPSWWFDEHPLLSAIQFHQAWAFGNGVNLLAANIYFPLTGSLGTGVYSGIRGILNATYEPRLITARVTNSPSGPLVTSNQIWTIPSSNPIAWEEFSRVTLPPTYVYKQDKGKGWAVFMLTKPSDDITSCNNGLCCSLSYNATSLEEDYYLVVFNGTRSLRESFFLGEEICMMVYCNFSGQTPCRRFPLKAQTNFTYVSLSADFSTSYVYPSIQATDMDLQSYNKWSYIFHNSTTASIEVFPRIPLLSVSLYGRAYDRDSIEFNEYWKVVDSQGKQ